MALSTRFRAGFFVAAAAFALSVAACANILGFEDLTSSGGTGSPSDGGTGEGGLGDGASGDGSLPGFDAPSGLTAGAVACAVDTLVMGSCDGGAICKPTSTAVDDAKQVYVIDQSNSIHVVTPAGAVSTLALSLADGGTPTLNQPSAVTFSHDDDSLYVADKYSVQHVALATGVMTPVAGSATFGHADDAGTKATFAGINQLAIEPGGTDIWIADHNDVRFIALPGDLVDTVTTGDRGLPQGIVSNGGEVYFATTNGMALPAGIYEFAAGTTSIAAYTTDLAFPGSLATFRRNLYVVNGNSAAVIRINLDVTPAAPSLIAGGVTGGTAVDGPCVGTARFAQPTGISVDSDEKVYVADLLANRIRTITQGFGQITVSWTPPPPPPGRSIDGYEARAKLGGTVAATCTTTTTSCIILGLTSGTTYDVTVVAKSGSDSSAESAAVQATPN